MKNAMKLIKHDFVMIKYELEYRYWVSTAKRWSVDSRYNDKCRKAFNNALDITGKQCKEILKYEDEMYEELEFSDFAVAGVVEGAAVGATILAAIKLLGKAVTKGRA